MVGSALVRALGEREGVTLLTRTRSELDLLDAAAVRAFYDEAKPDVVIMAAARVGGIHANATYPAEFMQENLAIAMNTIHEAFQAGVPRLLFLGSTCIYPRMAPQPIKEDSLLTGPLEQTNEAYALAKIAGLKLCQYYRRQYGLCYHSAMPTNLYGPGDTYHPENAHVLPALIRRFFEAKESGAEEVVIWGSGTPMREFLYADDAAAGILHLLGLEDPPDWVNLGSGEEVSIADLAGMVKAATGYAGRLVFDTSKPDGTPRKVCDLDRVKATGWAAATSLKEGIPLACEAFLEERADGTLRQ